jgi:hypothetical protein
LGKTVKIGMGGYDWMYRWGSGIPKGGDWEIVMGYAQVIAYGMTMCVVAGRETSTRVLHLCNFTQCATLLTEINDHPTSALLCLFYCFLDPEDEVWATRADIRSEHVTPIAL